MTLILFLCLLFAVFFGVLFGTKMLAKTDYRFSFFYFLGHILFTNGTFFSK